MATLIRADDAPRFGQDGFSMIGLAAPSPAARRSAPGGLAGEPGAASPFTGSTSDEVFVVLRGTLEVLVDDAEPVVARAGDAVTVPPGSTSA